MLSPPAATRRSAKAGNDKEAVAQYQALSPELVTLDITMPEKDGLQALGEAVGKALA